MGHLTKERGRLWRICAAVFFCTSASRATAAPPRRPGLPPVAGEPKFAQHSWSAGGDDLTMNLPLEELDQRIVSGACTTLLNPTPQRNFSGVNSTEMIKNFWNSFYCPVPYGAEELFWAADPKARRQLRALVGGIVPGTDPYVFLRRYPKLMTYMLDDLWDSLLVRLRLEMGDRSLHVERRNNVSLGGRQTVSIVRFRSDAMEWYLDRLSLWWEAAMHLVELGARQLAWEHARKPALNLGAAKHFASESQIQRFFGCEDIIIELLTRHRDRALCILKPARCSPGVLRTILQLRNISGLPGDLLSQIIDFQPMGHDHDVALHWVRTILQLRNISGLPDDVLSQIIDFQPIGAHDIALWQHGLAVIGALPVPIVNPEHLDHSQWETVRKADARDPRVRLDILDLVIVRRMAENYFLVAPAVDKKHDVQLWEKARDVHDVRSVAPLKIFLVAFAGVALIMIGAVRHGFERHGAPFALWMLLAQASFGMMALGLLEVLFTPWSNALFTSEWAELLDDMVMQEDLAKGRPGAYLVAASRRLHNSFAVAMALIMLAIMIHHKSN